MDLDGVIFRKARAADLPAIVALLADDELGRSREDPSLPLLVEYQKAFEAIDSDSNQFLAVAEWEGEVVGTLQLSYIPGLAHKGGWRGQIEAVHVAPDRRNAGLGGKMFAWAIDQCRARGCRLVQLTSDKARSEAHRFYDRLGFHATHEGYKLFLSD